MSCVDSRSVLGFLTFLDSSLYWSLCWSSGLSSEGSGFMSCKESESDSGFLTFSDSSSVASIGRGLGSDLRLESGSPLGVYGSLIFSPGSGLNSFSDSFSAFDSNSIIEFGSVDGLGI